MTTAKPMTDPLVYAIIGSAANIAAAHRSAIQKLPGAELVAMCDVDGVRGRADADRYGCRFFENYRALLVESSADIVVICTPHPLHAPIAIECVRAGMHAFVEKPLAIGIGEADRLVNEARAADRLVGVSFQQRFHPAIESMKRFLDDGELGPVVRALVIEPFPRPRAYYQSGPWRGTWAGEGGGVLMNQASHTLDLLCYLVGQPVRVWGWTRTRHHAIETEDTAQAMFELENGAPGYFATGTAEGGARRQLQILGERAALELNGDVLTIHRFERTLPDYIKSCPNAYRALSMQSEVVEARAFDGHLCAHRDFASAVRNGHRPRCDAEQARLSLELANAIILSSHSDRALRLPLDRSEYARLLERLRSTSSGARCR
jgi:predicted dehydrogenase